MAEKVTLFAVAELAGVSIATVSRVVNGLTTKGPTEERIRRAIDELGYEPHSAARALRVNASEQICLAFPDLNNPVYQAMTRGVQRGFKLSKYRLMLSPSLSTTEEVILQLKSLGRNYADGVILSTLVFDEEIEQILSTLRIPVVLVGGAIDRPKYDSIRVDSERGVGMVVDYFFNVGRKKILFLNGPWMTHPAKRRKKGFLESMRSHQVKNPENHIVNAKAFNPKAAVEVLSGVKNLNQFSAILCANDLLAAGAIKFFSERKIKIPDDIAVIGIDNTDLAGLLTPTLTSVDYKAEYRGELAARYLLERLENPNLPIKKTIIKPELIIRESA